MVVVCSTSTSTSTSTILVLVLVLVLVLPLRRRLLLLLLLPASQFSQQAGFSIPSSSNVRLKACAPFGPREANDPSRNPEGALTGP